MKTQTTTKTPDFLPATWKGGYMHTPQAIRELLARERISGMIQAQILLEINGEMSRQGEDGKPAGWAKGLTIPRFAAACGRDPKEQLSGVEKALADLLKRGLVAREPEGKTWLNGGKLQCKTWKYRIEPNAWRGAPKCVPPVDDGEDDAPEEQDAAQPDVQAKTWPADMLVAMPGKGSKSFRLGELRIRVAANETEAPIAFRFRNAENGDLEIRVEKPEASKHTEPSVDSERVNTNTSVLAEGSRAVESPKTSVLQEGSRPPAPPPTSPPDPLETYLAGEVAALVGSVVPAKIVSETRSNLNGTPIEYLKDRVRARAKRYNSHALLPHLAKDAAERYHAEQHNRLEPPISQNCDVPPPPPKFDTPFRREGTVAADLKHWATLPEEYREYYRKTRPAAAAAAESKALGGCA